MKKTRRTTEQIIRILREAESNGMKSEQVCRLHNISAQTYYRWKKKYGGMGLKEARRLRELEKENTELKKLLADQLLKARALEIALEKNICAPRGSGSEPRWCAPGCRVRGDRSAGGSVSIVRPCAIDPSHCHRRND